MALIIIHGCPQPHLWLWFHQLGGAVEHSSQNLAAQEICPHPMSASLGCVSSVPIRWYNNRTNLSKDQSQTGCIIALKLYSFFLITMLHFIFSKFPVRVDLIFRNNRTLLCSKTKVIPNLGAELQHVDDNHSHVHSGAELQDIVALLSEVLERICLILNITIHGEPKAPQEPPLSKGRHRW